jgi:teichuronic acid biosynthesis glycosyltransferase TuaG
MNHKVSIITPLYNAEAWIEETAQSIFNQTYQNWEWIIVNDCSKDNSLEVVQNLAKKDSRIRILSNEKNVRTAQTRNNGIRESKGKYLAFIDSDDIWHPQKLEKQVKFMQLTGAKLSYHAYRKFRGGMENQGELIRVPEKVNYNDLLKSNVIACLSAMYDTEALGKVEMPDGYKAREDYLTWLKILRTTNEYAHGINECLGYYRILQSSYSAQKKEMAILQWRLYREVEKLSLPRTVINFIFYALNGFLKASKI